MNANLEMKVLQNLLTNERFTREVVPNLELDYFTGNSKTIFESVVQFVTKYKKLPTLDAFLIDMQNNNKIGEEAFNQIANVAPKLFERDEVDYDWLLDATEKWCKDRAVQNALLKSISISEGKDGELSRDAIPDILQKALSVSFDKSVGHDYLEDFDARWEYYNREENRLPSHLEMLNTITNGGIRSKSLNIIMASTGVGKSTIMGDLAANHLIDGKNVLYISMEMSEEEIGERVDANLMDISIDQIKTLPKDIFSRKANDLRKKTTGSFIVKEYPTGAAHAGHFRALIKELEMKKEFKPDVIFIDYLNICASARMKRTNDMYNYVKSIAEELRGLAQEFDVPIWSATQSNRDGYNNSDPDLSNTSESFGLPATTDLFLVAISTPELENNRMIQFKQLKNRHGDLNKYNKFVVGIDRSKMRLYDAPSQEEQETAAQDDTPVFDRGSIAQSDDIFNPTEDWKL